MIDWTTAQKEYDTLVEALTNQDLDKRERANLQRQASHYAQLLELNKTITELDKTIASCQTQADNEQGEMKELYQEEIRQAQEQRAQAQAELEEKLYPADARNERSVFLEIRAGTGGQEAALFAADLFKMYYEYALTKNWKVSIVDSSTTDLGGYKEIIAFIEGKNVYKHLKYESGVHRVQRVPKTESAGRVHTSTVTVAVLPEAEEVDVDINPSDLRIDVYRSSGAGGQHVNTTDSAVRITHIPTGVVVTCQDERSQIKNKAKAMKVLQARIYEAERERQAAIESAERKQQVGAGERAEKIRTYNYPQNRITDHRVEITLKKLDIVMQGDLDDLVHPLIEQEVRERRAQGIILPKKGS